MTLVHRQMPFKFRKLTKHTARGRRQTPRRASDATLARGDVTASERADERLGRPRRQRVTREPRGAPPRVGARSQIYNITHIRTTNGANSTLQIKTTTKAKRGCGDKTFASREFDR